jgi:HAE1 family hydrophobic/amphiphilic exporter-1
MGGILTPFREFAVTIAAIFISALSPSASHLLCSRLLRAKGEKPPGVSSALPSVFTKGCCWDDLSLLGASASHCHAGRVLPHHCDQLLAVLESPEGFIPEQDTGQMYASTEATQGTSYYQMAKYQHQVADILRSDPNVSHSCQASAAVQHGANTGRMFMQLKPHDQRGLHLGRSSRDCDRSWRNPVHAFSCQRLRPSASEAACPEASTSSRCRGRKRRVVCAGAALSMK